MSFLRAGTSLASALPTKEHNNYQSGNAGLPLRGVYPNRVASFLFLSSHF